MPRARTASTEEEAIIAAPKKRAPRKRISRVDDESELSREAAPPKPRARRPRTPKIVEEATVVEKPVRRAPTPIQAERKAVRRGNRALVAVMLFFVLVAGSGVAIGMTDTGPIDVVAVVNERNERVGRGEVREGETSVTVPVQNMTGGANGGMVPADPSLVPTPPPPVEESASSTESTATSTDAMSTETSEEESAAVPAEGESSEVASDA